MHNATDISRHDDEEEHQEYDSSNDEEDLVYTAAQILAGNLDKKLHSFAGVVSNGINTKQQEDLGELRGRAVLGIFNLGDEIQEGNDDSRNNTNGVERNWAERAKLGLVSNGSLFTDSFKGQGDGKSDEPPMWKILRQPIISMAHVCIANSLVERALHRDKEAVKELLYKKGRQHIFRSLELWSCNPSGLLALANLTRMGIMDDSIASYFDTKPSTSDSYDKIVRQRMQQSMEQYMAAAKCAAVVRSYGMEKLFGEEKLESPDELFLVETIVLDLAAQVDLPDEESSEDDNDHDDDTNTCKDPSNKEDEQYGQSKVISTASYMAALLAIGHHDLAQEALAAFGDDVTRIHPAVWDAAANLGQCSNIDYSSMDNNFNHVASKEEELIDSNLSTTGAFTPSIFREAIPEEMARILRYAFRPDAPYWEQSGYDRGVYYSFWHDYHQTTMCDGNDQTSKVIVQNVVEDVIISYLLPRVRAVVGEEQLSNLAGFEWWVHTRPHGANLGHQLHFDTDEALLEQDQVVSFPICATVLYLNGDDHAVHGQNHKFGSTVLFDQTPYCNKNAERAWISTPRPRSFLVFPGNLLHGVLPCAPASAVKQNKNNRKRKSIKAETDESQMSLSNGSISNGTHDKPHRLTFMVNFWARNIPEKLKKRKLYGPSGPLPPKTRRHCWTSDLLNGNAYPSPRSIPNKTALELPYRMGILLCIEPAWERLNQNEEKDGANSNNKNSITTKRAPAEVPKSGINQRFFVKNAPDYFHSTLFEK
eukprot:CAMPEP_0176500636 /NCGR_PEP_ID=MMETSP0200_2-20121128/13685_1 /TAXON_ID=947934 /ORGANISM="Chaetoceros sp., Strain GSL56" /LENGTH=761 /DNA_ID=CAMNT_0017899373 /DNA_START=46 /DNA_END=2332 /DNA_ORIENTATION=-